MSDYPKVEDIDRCEALSQEITAAWKAQAQTRKSPSLWRVLISIYGPAYLMVTPLAAAKVFVQASQGWFLSKLLLWISTPSGDRDPNAGYYYALGIALDGFLTTILVHSEFFITIRAGMRIRVGLISTIFRKSLNLTMSGTASTGYIVNLISNDVQRFEDLAPFVHYFWIAVLQLVVFMYLIYLEIGWSFIAPVVCFFLVIPLQSELGRRFNALRKETVGYRDERIKSLSDMLTGILVVKLYAWIEPFVKEIQRLREAELSAIWKANIMKAFNYSFNYAAGAIVNAVTFVTFWLAGGVLTPAKVFPVLIYLNLMQGRPFCCSLQ
ncbi:hypothetical protein HDU91_007445 [Kappamyces sp. JEL0680]|nr:hypothetical protein HDU91_007445 [Kappamyces sp. JEL0680]